MPRFQDDMPPVGENPPVQDQDLEGVNNGLHPLDESAEEDEEMEQPEQGIMADAPLPGDGAPAYESVVEPVVPDDFPAEEDEPMEGEEEEAQPEVDFLRSDQIQDDQPPLYADVE